MVEWAKREEVQAAWKEMAATHGLSVTEEAELERIFGFLDGTLCRPAPLSFSPDKHIATDSACGLVLIEFGPENTPTGPWSEFQPECFAEEAQS